MGWKLLVCLRFIDPHNKNEIADFEKLKRWLPVDIYIGGAEHAVLHLLYARFGINSYMILVWFLPRTFQNYTTKV